MPRTCTICSHPQRDAIDHAIVTGMANRPIASQFQVGYKAVERHAAGHIKQAIKQSQVAKEEAQTLDVVRQLVTINTVTLAILKEARDTKENNLALQAVDRVMKQLELQAKLLGDLDSAPTVNVWLPTDWATIELAIASALAPFPQAAVAVADALARVEAGNAGLN